MSASVHAPRDANNFDLIRFVLAVVVFLFHAGGLTGRPELAPLSRLISAEFAVQAFFVVSGYLIFMSYERSGTLGQYFERRVRRIYPAYAFVVLACAAGGLALTRLPAGDYLASPGLLRYLGWNLVFLNFLQPTLPGVFEANPLTVVNGALWTLKVEVSFYLSVPVLAWLFRRLPRPACIAALYLLSVAFTLGLRELAGNAALLDKLQYQLPGQLTYFLAGAMFYYYPPGRRLALGLAVAALPLLLLEGPLQVLLRPLAVGAVVHYLALGMPYLGNFGRHGDFSYGVYILHFPILQALVALGAFGASAWTGMALALVLVPVAAWISWRWIEKPFLRRASHYVAAEDAPPEARP
ncbi:MAG TPA: acyltransferase [Burkholderiales bacterium]